MSNKVQENVGVTVGIVGWCVLVWMIFSGWTPFV